MIPDFRPSSASGATVDALTGRRRDPVGRQLEVHHLEAGAYRLAQTARAGDTASSVLMPGLGFDADELFTLL